MSDSDKAAFIEMGLKEYDQMDLNKDGKVDRAECIQALKNTEGSVTDADLAVITETFAAFDANNDGFITRDEFTQGVSKVFDQQQNAQ